MKKVKFDIGYGVEVESLHCENCGYNITDDETLEYGIVSLKEQMAKEVKIIKVGTGIGVRLPNDIAKAYHLKEKENVIIKPEVDGIKIVVARA